MLIVLSRRLRSFCPVLRARWKILPDKFYQRVWGRKSYLNLRSSGVCQLAWGSSRLCLWKAWGVFRLSFRRVGFAPAGQWLDSNSIRSSEPFSTGLLRPVGRTEHKDELFGDMLLSYIWGKDIPVEAIRARVIEENVVVNRSLFYIVQKIKLCHDKHDRAFWTGFILLIWKISTYSLPFHPSTLPWRG